MCFPKKKMVLPLVLATSLAMSVPFPSALALEEGNASGSGRAEQPSTSAVSPSEQGKDTASSGAEDIGGGRRLSIAGLLTGAKLLPPAITLTRMGSPPLTTLLTRAVSSLVPTRRLPRKRFR